MSMDAMEFIRERNRMCSTFRPNCDGCPAYENGWYCDNDAWNEKIVSVVEKWAEEHPRKTRQSVFLEQYPEAEIDKCGCLMLCPKRISADYRNSYGNCTNRLCSDCHSEFWMQEIE